MTRPILSIAPPLYDIGAVAVRLLEDYEQRRRLWNLLLHKVDYETQQSKKRNE